MTNVSIQSPPGWSLLMDEHDPHARKHVRSLAGQLCEKTRSD